MANYYDDMLKLCGFEDDEIKKEKPRIDKAFQKLELGPQDISFLIGIKQITAYCYKICLLFRRFFYDIFQGFQAFFLSRTKMNI